MVKRYENAVNWIDRQMEEFIAYLKEQGRYDNSIIILTGDHGEEFQENGAWFHCSSLRREQIEVPIMIRWPEWVQNQPRQDLVSHLDVMPSILEALGLDPKYFKGLAGSSVLGEHPGEALLSTRWPGKSGIGVCLVADKKKANFKATRLWLEGIPETLYFCAKIARNASKTAFVAHRRNQVFVGLFASPPPSRGTPPLYFI